MFAPDYSAATGLLQHLNSTELRQLLDDEDKLVSMIRDLQQVKQIESEREMLVASNKSLAEYNLSLKPELEQRRQEVIMQYEEAAQLKDKIETVKTCLVGKKSQTETDTVLALLQASTAEAEDVTEVLVEKLMNGETSVETFLKDYLKERTHVHILRTKSDKMASLLRSGNVNVTRLPPEKPRRTRKAPPPPPVPRTNGNQAPYPVLPPFPAAPSSNNVPIVPTRLAPKPPVQIPGQHSSSLQVETSHSNQSAGPRAFPSSMPYVPPVSSSYPYPQFVKLPN